MVEVGDRAPEFTVPLANGDVGPFTFSEHLDEAPIVLVFFPGAFTSVCTGEMRTLSNRLPVYEDAGATLYGVSVDSPFSLDEFREQEELEFGLLSDSEREIVEPYDLSTDFEALAYNDVAQRAANVVASDREIAYRWVADDVTREPDYDELEAAAESAT